MKILLLNDNPVVNKLVTLSAQKTSDDLEVISNLDEIQGSIYDLLVVDDTLYSDELFSQLEEKISFKKSLYICARDADDVAVFSNTLKKPFLPTDLVELFAMIGKEAENIELTPPDEVPEELESLDALEEITEISDEIEELEPLEELEELSFDEEEIDIDLDDELSLDEDEELSESVLDDEEAQKVKDLLDEADGLDDLEEELELEESESENEEPEEELSLDDLEEELELEESESENEEPEEELSLDDLEEELELDESEDEPEIAEEEELSLDDLEEELEIEEPETEPEMAEEELEFDEPEELDIEVQIENAMDELSEEDLESELDKETLLEIATGDIDPMDSLTSRELKLAIGEEVQEEELEIEEEPEIEEVPEIEEESENIEDEIEVLSDNAGVESLKKLLKALSDKNVAAAMKGMKISINISLGDE